MAEVAADLVVSSGIVQDGYQLVKRGYRKITKWYDRAWGLSVLKKLPTGLEALVFGEDIVAPELLAALSLGGRPGVQLSTIALLKAKSLGLFKDGEEVEGYLSTTVSPPTYHESIRDGRSVRTRADTAPNYDQSLMNDGLHDFTMLDEFRCVTKMRVHLRDTSLSLDGNALVEVIALFFPSKTDPLGSRGLVVRGEADGRYYYCENHWGELDLSSIDVPSTSSRSNIGSNTFMVRPEVLQEYSCVQRLFGIFKQSERFLANLLGLVLVAKELGEEFVTQSTGGGIRLLSTTYLRHVHSNPRRCSPTLQMPTAAELRTRVQETTENLTLRERDIELVLFSSMREIVEEYVKTVESEATRPGNVGVQPYEKQLKSDLIKSSIFKAVGIDTTFAIFEGFRKHKLNIAVSPGCTAVYFPGLSITVALPEGFEEKREAADWKPACPFTSDLEESLGILLDLAPKFAKYNLRKFAQTLTDELSEDPSRALSPVTEKVGRALGIGSGPRQFSLADLFDYLETKNPESTWGEASVAGILCQLGVTFSLPPPSNGNKDKDFRCFFQVCREVCESTFSGPDLVVNCGVDISGCQVFKGEVEEEEREGFFLRTVPWDNTSKAYELTSGVSNVPRDELRKGFCFLHRPVGGKGVLFLHEPMRIPKKCRVIGFGTPTASLEVPPEESTCSIC